MELRGVPQHNEYVLLVDGGLNVLDGELLQTLRLQKKGQLVDVHHEQHLGNGHATAWVNLEIWVNAVVVHRVECLLESLAGYAFELDRDILLGEKARSIGIFLRGVTGTINLEDLSTQVRGSSGDNCSVRSDEHLIFAYDEMGISEELLFEQVGKVVDKGALGKGGERETIKITTSVRERVKRTSEDVEAIVPDSCRMEHRTWRNAALKRRLNHVPAPRINIESVHLVVKDTVSRSSVHIQSSSIGDHRMTISPLRC